MILFGSSLLKKHFPDYRKPNDVDWLVSNPEDVGTIVDDNGITNEYYYIPVVPHNREMTPDECYTLKVSHAIRDIHWSKTMSDIRFMQLKDCKLVPSFLKDLREHWNQVHGTNHRTDFTKDSKSFFKDNVKRVIDHDKAHVLLNPTPSYLKIVKPDETGVMPHEHMFFDLSIKEQNMVAFEEAYVIALERFKQDSLLNAYHQAQRILVTRLHPVWLADFVIENWNQVFWNGTNGGSLFQRFKQLKEEVG